MKTPPIDRLEVFDDIEYTNEREFSHADKCVFTRYQKRKEFIEALKAEGLYDLYMSPTVQYTREELIMFNKIQKATEGKMQYTVDELIEEINKYFAHVDEQVDEIVSMNTAKKALVKGRSPYTIEGMCNWLGITKGELEKFKANPKYKEYKRPIEMAEQLITQKILEGALKSEYNAQVAKLYLKNISDLRDKESAKGVGAIGDITFITVGSRKELQTLNEGREGFNGEIVDAEYEDELAEEQSVPSVESESNQKG